MDDEQLRQLRIAAGLVRHARNCALSSRGSKRQHHARAFASDAIRLANAAVRILEELEQQAWDEPAQDYTPAQARAIGARR